MGKSKSISFREYQDLLESLKVGEIYRYIGDGEFEIVDVADLAKKAVTEYNKSKLP